MEPSTPAQAHTGFLQRLQKPPVILAPMPKTASNTLLQRLESCIDAAVIKPKSGGGIGHFIIDDRTLRQAYKTIPTRKTPLIYQHFLPTRRNRLTLFKHLNIAQRPKVTVSVRNIYDVAISCADHQNAGYGPWWITRSENDFFAPGQENNHAYIWNALTCLKFYTAWAIAAQGPHWDIKFINYDDILDKADESLQSVLGFYSLPGKPGAETETIRDNVNKGVKGRGADLDPYAKDLLKRFAATFQNIDFTPVGL